MTKQLAACPKCDSEEVVENIPITSVNPYSVHSDTAKYARAISDSVDLNNDKGFTCRDCGHEWGDTWCAKLAHFWDNRENNERTKNG